jgi:hypothetical protein
VQAAGYLRDTGRDLASYAELLHPRLAEVMQEGKPEDYPLTSGTAWTAPTITARKRGGRIPDTMVRRHWPKCDEDDRRSAED